MDNPPKSDQTHRSKGAGGSHYYKFCLEILQNASSDTEKMSCLFVIVQYLVPDKLSNAEILSIFDHIGCGFLSRLLLPPEISPSIPRGTSSISMHSIAINIFHIILKVKPDHLSDHRMFMICVRISIILNSLNKENNGDEEKLLRDDIIPYLQCLIEISPDKQRLTDRLVKSGTIPILFNLLNSSNVPTHDIFSFLCKAFCNLNLSSKEPEYFHKFMLFTASQFKSNQSQEKFDLCNQLAKLIQQNEEVLIVKTQSCQPSTSTSSSRFPPSITTGPADWLPLITEGLYDILSSRLDKQRRDPAFYLIVTLNKVFPLFAWMTRGVYNFQDTRCKNFLPLVLRLVCIEICIELRKEDELIDDQLLNACFILVESLINTICAEPGSIEITLKLTPNDIVNLYNCLRETILTIIDFVKNVSHDWDEIDSDQTTFSIVMGCIRIICFWTLEDLTGIDDKMIDLIPFMVQLLHDQESFNIVGHFIIPSFYEICVNCDDSDPLRRSILSYDVQESLAQFQSMSPLNDQMDEICEAFRNLK